MHSSSGQGTSLCNDASEVARNVAIPSCDLMQTGPQAMLSAELRICLSGRQKRHACLHARVRMSPSTYAMYFYTSGDAALCTAWNRVHAHMREQSAIHGHCDLVTDMGTSYIARIRNNQCSLTKRAPRLVFRIQVFACSIVRARRAHGHFLIESSQVKILESDLLVIVPGRIKHCCCF